MLFQTLLQRWLTLANFCPRQLLWRFQLATVIALAAGGCFQVQATEFIAAHKSYVANGVGYRETGAEAVQAYTDYLCNTYRYTNCTNTYTGDGWGGSAWTWRGNYSFTMSDGSRATQNISGTISYGCPDKGGWAVYQLSTNPGRCSRDDQPVVHCESCEGNAKGDTSPKVGNPIVVNGGIKQQVETDYSNVSGTLRFTRTYRSDEGRWLNNYQIVGIDPAYADPKQRPDFACYAAVDSSTGKPWCFGYAGNGSTNSFSVRRGAGRLVNFGTAADFAPPKDINDRVSPILDEAGQRSGWRVTNTASDTVEVFSLAGYLLSSTARNGQVTTFSYSDASTPATIAPKPGLLLKVQDAFGHALQFSYDSQGRLATMTDPAGNAYVYEYDTQGNLAKVTYPDGKYRSYLYNELDKTSNRVQTGLLTGIVDENNHRYATYTYAVDKRAASTEHAGGVEKYAATYPSGSETNVLDPLNATYVYAYATQVGVLKRSSTRRPGPGGVGTVTATINYDANGNPWMVTDFDGSRITYTHDLSRNLEITRVEASTNALARTISTEWHASMRLPLRIAEPLRRTTSTYDAAGNVLTKTVQATADANGAAGFNATVTGTARTWTYTYSSLGQLLTVTGPRTGATDTTTYTYDEQGNLSTVTNALGHVTTWSNYDAHGRAGRVTDPNGFTTDFIYTLRGWLSSTTAGAATTSYTYDNAGQLTSVTMSGGATLSYTYDAAHRLTAVTDSVGNSVQYTLDNMGNRTGEQVKDSSGALMRQIARVYDPLNRLKQITGAQQ